jgi:hypothetical protein
MPSHHDAIAAGQNRPTFPKIGTVDYVCVGPRNAMDEVGRFKRYFQNISVFWEERFERYPCRPIGCVLLFGILGCGCCAALEAGGDKISLLVRLEADNGLVSSSSSESEVSPSRPSTQSA